MLRSLSSQIKIIWVLVFSFLYIALNAVLTYNEIYYLNVLPLIMILVYIAFTRLDIFLYIIVFCVPLSISLQEIVPGLDFNVFIPTEPAIFTVLVLFIFRIFLKNKIDKRILFHPISIAIYINLFWLLITSITSTMPIVSFKFLLSRLWFIVAFYFAVSQIFTKISGVKKFLWLYIFAFLIVIVYTLINHLTYGLSDKQVSHFVMQPFYNDHTAYGALLAMFIPPLIALVKLVRKDLTYLVFGGLLIVLFCIALIFSYSRAAWISIVVALCLLAILYFKIRFEYVFIVVGLLSAFFFVNREDIMLKMEMNNQDSSAKLSEHVQSMSNISTDASNLERINRWDCAFRMFKERPVFGWGPGTYMFKYAPFQQSKNLTIISTNSGNRGNAHSEYIGPLAESGVIGSLSFILIAIVSVLTGIRVYFKTKHKEVKVLSVAILLGLVTYFVHGTLNNFLDTDKASVPFWGFLAMLTVFDIYFRDSNYPKKIEENN